MPPLSMHQYSYRKVSGVLPVLIVAALFLQWTPSGYADEEPRVEFFAPEGTVRGVRQVHARFSAPMVPFGDLRDVAQPFVIDCPEPGNPRWVDDRNWIYDFDRDLPAGVYCTFTVRDGIRSLAENDVTGRRHFSFSTGGPAILNSNPPQGITISEDQVFVLGLDAEPDRQSVLDNVYFAVEGIASRIAVRILTGPERESILKATWHPTASDSGQLLLIQARQHFPNESRVSLVWDRGVAASSGIETEQAQVLRYTTRPVFTARFSCERVNPTAGCVPVSPMRIEFSAPVSRAVAEKIVIVGPEGGRWRPEETGQHDEDAVTQRIEIDGPFPELSSCIVQLPPGIEDDAGRPLANDGSFPLAVRTDEYPPLVKFASAFGIIEYDGEYDGDSMLPVTLRNVESSVTARMMMIDADRDEPVEPVDINAQPAGGGMEGRIFKVPSTAVNEMMFWINRIRSRSEKERHMPLLDSFAAGPITSFSIPRLEGEKAFEVVGIPLKSPGFYVVEIESELLGAGLLDNQRPMYVPAAALVTNLSVHFKWGEERSLAWVTSLNDGKPVEQAGVEVRDCTGRLLWEGVTDRQGIAAVDDLPSFHEAPRCSGGGFAASSGVDRSNGFTSGLVISTRAGGDMAFVHTGWNDGIEPWRFQLPYEWSPQPDRIHTIFDRALFRPGETVHMKHILRRRTLEGFGSVSGKDIGDSVRIVHRGSDQAYVLPLEWNDNGSAETVWEIPGDARLGDYDVVIGAWKEGEPSSWWVMLQSGHHSGGFNVEEYRVPLMRAVLRPPPGDLVSPAAVSVDMTVMYLAGGTAGQLPVRFRYLLEPRHVVPPAAYDGFRFSNGRVREGLVRADYGEEEGEEDPREKPGVRSMDLTLDRSGSATASIDGLPLISIPMRILAELDYRDPSGEVQTASARIPLWPASRMIGIRPDGWALSRDSLKLQVVVLDLAGKPVAGAPVTVNLFERRTYSHRKRLVGGFYSYEHSTETRKLQELCSGTTDSRGLLFCEQPVSVSGNTVLEASTIDPEGRETTANRDVWIAGARDWWFTATDSDRMDVLPEEKRYEPGQTARFQVRMPFREATALVTVEREGIAETHVMELSGTEPVIELPVKPDWAPNVFISVLAVRGRIGDVQPTGTVDLGRPAFRLGIAEIQVGWKAHELKVTVETDRESYRVRDKVKARISVVTADGRPLPRGSEVAVAAVDEGLLELMPNESWNLLDAMMGRRAYGVQSATAQMHVIGKRHFGLKALPQGGGGGQALTRELFDTLLFWKGSVRLDNRGRAEVEIPLNDSITGFRIVAIATGGTDRFGTGSTSIRTTQDLMLFSGIPPLVREGDEFTAVVTVRNATDRSMPVSVSARVEPDAASFPERKLTLRPGESEELHYRMTAPAGTGSLNYTIGASGRRGASDRLSVTQKVVPLVPVRTLQATLEQLDRKWSMMVERPADALPGGGIRASLQARLVDGLKGVIDFMERYDYTCLEQVVSKAVALRDEDLWRAAMKSLPGHLDEDGLLKYFPTGTWGDDVLTAYVLALAHQAEWELPADAKERMISGLARFVEGHVTRSLAIPASDLAMRKLAAIEALSREGRAAPSMLSTITIAPDLWPTSAVID
jgi:alpha-2-macroglobulin